jgi:hypothetical protein
MRLPQLFKTDGLVFDEDKVLSYHEAAHGLIFVAESGLLPQFTSLTGINGGLGFSSSIFEIGFDLGIDWQKAGPSIDIMHSFAGIVGAAWYTGEYDWSAARSDMDSVEKTVALYPHLTFRLLIMLWERVHKRIEQHADLLIESAEKLHRDGVLGWEHWEQILLTPNFEGTQE